MKLRSLSVWRWLFVAIFASLLLGVAACSDDEEAGPSGTQQFDGDIKIGFLLDLSGPGGATATTLSHQVGGKSAIDAINADGGVEVAGKKYRLVQVIVDAKSDPVQTSAGALDLLSQGVSGVYIGSAVFADQAYQQLKGKVVSWSASPGVTYHIDSAVPIPGEGPTNNPTLFSNIDAFHPIVLAHLKMAVEAYPAIKKIGILATNAPIGIQLTASVEKASNELGLTFVGSELAPFNTSDLSSFVTNLKAKGPDFVFFVTLPSIIEGVNAAIEGNLAKYYGVWTLRPIEIARQLRPLGNAVVISPDWRLPMHDGLVPDKYKDAVTKLGDLPGGEPRHTGWAISEWDWIHNLAQAYEKAGTFTDPLLVANALRGQVYSGDFGSTDVLANQTSRGTIGQMIKDGNTYTVWGWDSIDAVLADKPPLFKEAAPATEVE